MATRTLHTRFEVAGTTADKVMRAHMVHELARVPWLEIEFRTIQYLPLENLIGQKARFEVSLGDSATDFAGIVEEASVTGSPATATRIYTYAMRVVPRIGLLERNVGCVIYQEKDVKEIVTEVLERHQISEFEWRLTGSYLPRVYCVQYRESDLDFVHRLLEHEGIYYFVETDADGDKVIFADDSTAADTLEGDPVLPVRGNLGMAGDGDYALIPTDCARVRSGKHVLRDYNHEKPALDLTAEAESDVDTDLEVYDFPGEYDDAGEGKRLAQMRLEAEQVERFTLSFGTVCPRVQPGRCVEITDASELDGKYFLYRAEHRFGDIEGDVDYTVDVRSLPADTPYRRPCTTPKPKIYGPQTARVVAPAGSPGETVHTDEQGRVKVKFHWDRTDVNDDKASCWMRVAQLQTPGSLVLPRINWEVIVEFIEGNPDRPIVTGRLYNGAFRPPYQLPEGKTRTSLQTRSTPGGSGSNEIRFEDQAGAEEIMIYAQKDMTLQTANNKTKTVGNNETTVIGSNSSLSVGADQTVKVTMGAQNTIGADQSVSVGGNRNLEVNAVLGSTIHGAASTTVGGNQMEMDGNPLEALLNLAAQAAQEFLEAKAGEAVAAIEAHVQGAVDQALGPIADLTAQAESLGNNMQAVADGDMAAIGGMVGDASGIPGAGDFARSLGGGGDPGPAGGPLSDVVEGGNLIQQAAGNAVSAGSSALSGAANQAIGAGVGAAHNALASALGVDASGGGGASNANRAGPEGDVSGQDETDRSKGPGHDIDVVAGNYSETVGGMKITGLLTTSDTNVGGDMTQNAGAAHVEIVIGNRAENADGNKTETALGLAVLTKGGESESVGGAKTAMVGAAVVDKLKGSHEVSAGGPATFIGAFHKLEAKGSITLKCGGSEVVIDGGGITVKAAAIAFMGGKLHLPKDVSEA